jgi:nitrogen-specific signal transduction histidine kinase/CheY-like chemotaxis protein
MIPVFFGAAADPEKRERDLQAALESARKANSAKSDFLSRISHEIRTPMNAIIGMTNIARKSPDMSKIQRCLENIDVSAKLLMGILNDILDMSNIEAHKLELLNAPFDLRKMLEDVRAQTEAEAGEKRQAVTFYVDDSLGRIYVGDEMRLSQVVFNLTTNAVKFTPERGSITLRARQKETRGSEAVLEVSVEDTGIGISPENLTKIFTPFEQIEGGIARKFGGMGLGLVISKSIVDLMGGTFDARSEVGRGSVFTFTAKLLAVKETPDNSEPELPNLKGRRILVVDGTQMRREVVKSLLEEAGAIADGTADGSGILEMFSRELGRYDLLLLDAEADACETVRALRKADRGRPASIPVIAMIDENTQEEVEQYADAYVVKPVDSRELYRKLAYYLKTAGEPAGPAAEKKSGEIPVVPTERAGREEEKGRDEKKADFAQGAEDARLLPFIDVGEALAHLNGHNRLYVTLLRTYRKSGMLGRIEEAFERQDLEEALQNALALKSVAVNLGLRDLQAKTAFLVETLRGGVADRGLLEKVEISMKETQSLVPGLILRLEKRETEGKIAS